MCRVSKQQDTASVAKTRVGTPGYTAPELLSGSFAYDGAKADVWSLGVILYLLVFGKHPFYDDRDSNDGEFTATAKRIREGRYEYPSDLVSPGLKDLLARIFMVEPANRISMSGIFSHPWVRKSLPQEALKVNESCAQDKGYQEHIKQTRKKLTKILESANNSL